MTHLLILGGGGQVGRALAEKARAQGIPHAALGRAECDITDARALESAVAGAHMAVNCAAFTAVDAAEQEEETAYRVNALGAGNVAAACAAAGIPILHISTDYVFNGESPRPYREDDIPGPLNAYGRSKLAGEENVRKCQPAHVILRTSWIFSGHGQNFVTTMLRLARSESELRVVHDQVGGPTAANDIAEAIVEIVLVCKKPEFAGWGTYHLAGTPAVSWYEFARASVGEGGPPVVPAGSAEFPRPARRPRKSVLDCSRIARVFGIAQPDWRARLAQLREALGYGSVENGQMPDFRAK